MAFLTIVVVCGVLSTAFGESVLFPSGERFTSVNESSLSEEDVATYTDSKSTGTYLYDSLATDKMLTKRLAMNILVEKYKSPTARYFRAAPTFLKCAEQVILKLLRDDIRVNIVRGYMTASESTGSDVYGVDTDLQSGSAIQLAIKGDAGTIEDIATAVLKVCPVILERAMRDLNMVIMVDRVHFAMSGPDSAGPSVRLDGYTGIPNLDEWVEETINAGLEPSTTTTCENYKPLVTGEHHPALFQQDRVVGTLDEKITRDMTTDFQRLVQYQGSNIVFENTEGSPCSAKLQGNTVDNRCSDKIMSSRLLNVLNKLQKKVRLDLSDKLKVLEAWDEGYAGSEMGDSESDPLHYEGRAAKVALFTSDDVTKLGELSKYAICLGGDYVEHRGTYIYVSVKRMQVGGTKVKFPSIELMGVDIPTSVSAIYNLPSVYTDKEVKQYPLFDSSGRLETPIASNVTIGQFVSKDNRYFRLNPHVLDCYVDIVYQENKRRKDGDPKIEVEVVRGFLTNRENDRKFDVIKDKRYNTHNMGLAMQLRYKQTDDLPATHTPYRLFYTVLHKCSSRFYGVGKQMGIGLYPDSVYVGMRNKYLVMEDSLDNLPPGVDPEAWDEEIDERYLLARDKRIVDPDDYDTACLFQTAPKPQSLHFKHEHTEAVKRRRKRSIDETACVPTRETKFCLSTKKHRDDVIIEIKSMLDRKHYRDMKTKILEALDGCFGDCGTCTTGEIYDSKVEHCNNFLHWVDWTLMNTAPDTTNFFVRSNRDTTRHACEGGNDCIENSPLFSLVAPSVEKIYRPDPTKSVEEELYSSANNPSPVFSRLEDIYAIQASGIVKFWARDDTEMKAMKRQLEVVMLYNTNVTQIEIYVERYNIAADSIRNIAETAARVMTTQGCPEVTRETLTPFVVLEVPTEKRKRAAEPQSLRHHVREYYREYEARWADRNMYL